MPRHSRRPCLFQRFIDVTRFGDTSRIIRETGARSHTELGDHCPALPDYEEGNGVTVTGRPGRWPAATGMSQTAISRIWRAFGLRPHLVDMWELSTDLDKVRDVVGLYLDPTDKAMMLHWISPPERSSASTNVVTGTKSSCGYSNRRRQHPGRAGPAHCPQQLRHSQDSRDQEMAGRSPAIPSAFHPTSSIWRGLVERWFAELTNGKRRRSSRHSVQALEDDVNARIVAWNDDPRGPTSPRCVDVHRRESR